MGRQRAKADTQAATQIGERRALRVEAGTMFAAGARVARVQQATRMAIRQRVPARARQLRFDGVEHEDADDVTMARQAP